MAIYRCEAKVIGRADNPLGRSVVAAAAYRSGTRLKDEKYGYRPDYSRRQAGVVHAEILAPESAPAWASDREKLWNEVERREDESTRRKSAQLAREFIIAIPHELSADERRGLVLSFVKEELVSRGMIADVSIHEPKQGKNCHCHILCTMREISPEGFGAKERDWNDTGLLVHWRKSWEEHCNSALQGAGFDERVDSRSLADQGIDREPEPKIGAEAMAMKRRGIEHDPERFRLVRHVRMQNYMRSVIGAVRSVGEVFQHSNGETWWERARHALMHVQDRAVDLLHDESSGSRPASWQEYVSSRAQKEPEREPEIEPGG